MFLLEEMGNTGSTISGGLSSLTGLLGGLTGSGGSSGGLSALTGLLGSLTGGSGGSTGALSSITSLLSTFANASSGGGLDLSSILQSITGSSSSSSGGGIDVASILSKITGLVSGSNSQISDIIGSLKSYLSSLGNGDTSGGVNMTSIIESLESIQTKFTEYVTANNLTDNQEISGAIASLQNVKYVKSAISTLESFLQTAPSDFLSTLNGSYSNSEVTDIINSLKLYLTEGSASGVNLSYLMESLQLIDNKAREYATANHLSYFVGPREAYTYLRTITGESQPALNETITTLQGFLEQAPAEFLSLIPSATAPTTTTTESNLETVTVTDPNALKWADLMTLIRLKYLNEKVREVRFKFDDVDRIRAFYVLTSGNIYSFAYGISNTNKWLTELPLIMEDSVGAKTTITRPKQQQEEETEPEDNTGENSGENNTEQSTGPTGGAEAMMDDGLDDEL